jgi:hypothetical protein
LIAVQQNPDSRFTPRSCGVPDVIVVALLDSAGGGAKKWRTKIAETRIWRTDIQDTDTGTSKGNHSNCRQQWGTDGWRQGKGSF